jgi:hypothetical protein
MALRLSDKENPYDKEMCKPDSYHLIKFNQTLNVTLENLRSFGRKHKKKWL